MNGRARALGRVAHGLAYYSGCTLLGVLAAIGPGAAAEPGDCSQLDDDRARLACYDERAVVAPGTDNTYLERHWDLSGHARILRPWAHRPTYLLVVRGSDAPNEQITDDSGDGGIQLDAVEAKFQVSFKAKLWEGMFGGPGNLWFGYTQQSHFQVYNGRESRPFRETDYEPEVNVAFPARTRWGRWTWRVIGAGIIHQSNGQTDPLSRSWNRVQGFAAAERGALSIELRPWWVIGSSDDDNEEIEERTGRFEATALWTRGRHALSVRGRSNLDVDPTGGSIQADWFFPLTGNLRGHLQLFTGYGESLIDYKHRQTTVGVGFLLFDPF